MPRVKSKGETMRVLRLCSPAVGALVFGLNGAAHAGLVLYGHTETVTNNTGKTANDITLELLHPALDDPGRVSIASGAFFGPGATATGKGSSTVTITGAPGQTVANGTSTTVGWMSAFASDLLLNTSFWTSNGTNIGPVTTNNA